MIKSIIETFQLIFDSAKILWLAMKEAHNLTTYVEDMIPPIKVAATLGSILGIISLINWLRKK